MTDRDVEREIARGRVFVDAPSAQRCGGTMLATAGVIALPAALTLLEPPLLTRELLPSVALLGLFASSALYFAGLAVSASAGRVLETKRGASGVLFQSGPLLLVHTEDGSWTVPIASLRGGFYHRATGTLALTAAGDLRIAVGVSDERAAARILAALGLDGRVATLDVVRDTRAARVVEGCAAGIAGLFVSLLAMLATVIAVDATSAVRGGLLVAVLLVAALAPILLTIRYVSRFGAPLRVALGTEGVLVGLRPEPLHIAYEDIEAVEACESGVIVRHVDGSDHFIRTAEASLLASAIVDRLEATPVPSERLDSLGRAGLDYHDWRRRLDVLAESEDRYRAPHLDPERLAAIVEDPRVPLDERVAAAYILGTRGDADLRTRVRAAAVGSAHPRLREALVAAMDGEIEAAAIEEAAAAVSSRVPAREHTFPRARTTA